MAADPHTTGDADVPTWRETTADAEVARVRAVPVRSVDDLERFRTGTFDSDEEVDEFAAFVRALCDADVR